MARCIHPSLVRREVLWTESDELVVAIRAQEPGDEVTLTVRRGEEVFDVDLTLQAAEQD